MGINWRASAPKDFESIILEWPENLYLQKCLQNTTVSCIQDLRSTEVGGYCLTLSIRPWTRGLAVGMKGLFRYDILKKETGGRLTMGD